MALTHPDCSFTLLVSDKQRLHTAKGKEMHVRIAELYGKDFAAELLPVSYEQLPLRLNGYLSDLSAKPQD